MTIDMFKNRTHNYLAGEEYTYIHTCAFSISQRIPYPQPSEQLLAWLTTIVKSC